MIEEYLRIIEFPQIAEQQKFVETTEIVERSMLSYVL